MQFPGRASLCWSFDRVASVAAGICRQIRRTLLFVRLSAPFARDAPTRDYMEFARIAVASWYVGRFARSNTWRTILQRKSDWSNPMVAANLRSTM
jgi:hypothetical protein